MISKVSILFASKPRAPRCHEWGKSCLVLLLLAGISACQDQPGFMAAPPASVPTVELAAPEGRVKPASYLVMFKTDNKKSSLYFSNFFDEYQHHYLALSEQFISDPRVKSIDILSATDLSRHETTEWVADFPAPTGLQLFWDDNSDDLIAGAMARVDFASQKDAEEVLAEWDLQGRLWYAEPNGISEPKIPWDEFKTNYASAGISWHKNIALAEAMSSIAALGDKRPSDASIADSPPVIAVLDSGVDYSHQLLKTSIWVNTQPGAAGCEGDTNGCNTTAPSKGSLGNGEVWPVGASGPGVAVTGEGKHGTHVAGLIAGTLDAGKGVGGVCPVCKIMILKVAEIDSSSGSGTPGITDDSQIRGLKYVTRFKTNNKNAVRIVNSSFGKYTRSRSVAILVDVLKKLGNGTMVIAAASNEDSMIRSYPAALNNAIGVASLEADNRKSSFSNFGPWVDVAAPGRSLVSTLPGDTVGESSGTSMASPVVAGAAGLYLAMNPNASFAELRSRILDCADASIYTANTDGAKFNATNYFTQLAGEETRRPLLGSGIVNVNNMITGTCKSSVGKPLDRVTAGCGAIANSGASGSLALLFVFLTGPLTFLASRRWWL